MKNRRIELTFERHDPSFEDNVWIALDVYKDGEVDPNLKGVATVKFTDDKSSFYFPEKYNKFSSFKTWAQNLYSFLDLDLKQDVMAGLTLLDMCDQKQYTITHQFELAYSQSSLKTEI